jgi:hypothetical protein
MDLASTAPNNSTPKAEGQPKPPSQTSLRGERRPAPRRAAAAAVAMKSPSQRGPGLSFTRIEPAYSGRMLSGSQSRLPLPAPSEKAESTKAGGEEWKGGRDWGGVGEQPDGVIVRVHVKSNKLIEIVDAIDRGRSDPEGVVYILEGIIVQVEEKAVHYSGRIGIGANGKSVVVEAQQHR